MKNIVKTLTLLAAITAVSYGAMAGGIVSDTMGGLAAKHKSLFIHKAQKKLIGGQVEIFSNGGELLAMQTLHKKKMVIDFDGAKLGVYTIRITKNGDTKEFHFIKK